MIWWGSGTQASERKHPTAIVNSSPIKALKARTQSYDFTNTTNTVTNTTCLNWFLKNNWWQDNLSFSFFQTRRTNSKMTAVSPQFSLSKEKQMIELKNELSLGRQRQATCLYRWVQIKYASKNTFEASPALPTVAETMLFQHLLTIKAPDPVSRCAFIILHLSLTLFFGVMTPD